jgi:hypothetical protein
VGLHSALFRFSRELQYGPFYVRLTKTEYSSIDLCPLPKASKTAADDDSGVEMGQSADENSTSASSNLETIPKTVARVLVAIHLAESPRGDLVSFLRDEGMLPQYVNGIEVIRAEAVFESNSTLAILSIPIGLWDLMPEELPCSYIGVTYSRNLLDSDTVWQISQLSRVSNTHPAATAKGPDQVSRVHSVSPQQSPIRGVLHALAVRDAAIAQLQEGKWPLPEHLDHLLTWNKLIQHEIKMSLQASAISRVDLFQPHDRERLHAAAILQQKRLEAPQAPYERQGLHKSETYQAPESALGLVAWKSLHSGKWYAGMIEPRPTSESVAKMPNDFDSAILLITEGDLPAGPYIAYGRYYFSGT